MSEDFKIYMTYSFRAILLGLAFLFALKVGMLDGLLGLDEDKKPAVKVEKPVVEKPIKAKVNRPEAGVAITYKITYTYSTQKDTILFPSVTSCFFATRKLIPNHFRSAYGEMTVKSYSGSDNHLAFFNIEKHKDVIKYFSTTCIEADK